MAIPTNRFAAFWIAFGAILLAPRLAFACANCFAASNPGTLRAYYLSTVILTLMPFILIAAIAFVGYKSSRGHRSSQPEEIPCEYH
jgi:hypothetical protein